MEDLCNVIRALQYKLLTRNCPAQIHDFLFEREHTMDKCKKKCNCTDGNTEEFKNVCIICNYKTNHDGNFKRHNKRWHKKKIQEKLKEFKNLTVEISTMQKQKEYLEKALKKRIY